MLNWFEQLAQGTSEAVTAVLGPIAGFLEKYVWQWPEDAPLLAIVLLGTGLFVTIRLGFIQLRGFAHAWGIASGRYDDPDDEGDLKHYQALTTALSATVGIGNIAGVALAIRLGGPGALFWMWLTAFFGMALKYLECTLALAHRKVHKDGSVSGGPMYYIELGMGKRWKWMGVFFAACAVISSFGSGNMNQSNTMADQVQSQFGVHPIWTALVSATLVAMVIIGGIRRIGKVTAILAPFMALLYVSGALVIIFLNMGKVPETLGLIVTQAFAPAPMVGGAAGSFLITLMWGIRRGLFSNEAGQGSAPIAHAAAKTKEPVREGLVASLGPFIDTLVICTMTGLVVLMTGAWLDKVDKSLSLGEIAAVAVENVSDVELRSMDETAAESWSFEVVNGNPTGATVLHLSSIVEGAHFVAEDGSAWSGMLVVASDGATSIRDPGPEPSVQGQALLTGAPLTALGFQKGLPGNTGTMIVTLAVLLFAISTAISWSYYGDRATEYLFGAKAIPIYRWVFIFFFFLGAILPLKAVWTFGDVALGLMSFPNLIALIALSGGVVTLTKEYFSREHKPYK